MTTRSTYHTRQKEVIADHFSRHPDVCLTAEEVYASLGGTVGVTTVYRTVARLWSEGLLRRYAPQSAGSPARYQWSPCGKSHLHLRCVECGALEHLRCDVATDFEKHLQGRHGFELDESRTVLYGLCKRCAAEKERKSRLARRGGAPGQAAKEKREETTGTGRKTKRPVE